MHGRAWSCIPAGRVTGMESGALCSPWWNRARPGAWSWPGPGRITMARCTASEPVTVMLGHHVLPGHRRISPILEKSLDGPGLVMRESCQADRPSEDHEARSHRATEPGSRAASTPTSTRALGDGPGGEAPDEPARLEGLPLSRATTGSAGVLLRVHRAPIAGEALEHR